MRWFTKVVLAMLLLTGCASHGVPDDMLGSDLGVGNDLAADDMSAAVDMAAMTDMTIPPDANSSPDSAIPTPKTVFITSTTYDANLGGIIGADAKCQARAQAAGLSGTFKAWLSDSALSPSMPTRFTHSTGSYVLVNGAPIAKSWTQLTSGTLLHAIDINELGGGPPSTSAVCAPSGGSNVWTDTNDDGSLFMSSLTCGDWTDATGTASAWGEARTQQNWTASCHGGNSAAVACGSVNALFCFEQ